MGVVINYASLVSAVLVFELIKYGLIMPNWIGFSLLGIFMMVLVFTFTYAYGLTGIWSLAHKKTEKLDEREIQVVTHSIRISYTIFAILVILIVYLFAIFGMGPFDVIIAATLLYLAHILPTSILAWTEKEV